MNEQKSIDGNKSIKEKLLQKIDYWRKKLLDLTLRNRLISFKDTKTSTLLLQNKNTTKYLMELLQNNEINIYKFDNQGNGNGNGEESESIEEVSIKSEKELEEVANNLEPNVWIPNHADKETEKRLYNLYLRSLESLREQGINTLFFAFGFLNYTDTKHSDQEIKAPLLLISIEISKLNKLKKNRQSYSIHSLEDGYQINPALKQKLLSEYNLNLPELVISTDETIEKDISVWMNDLSKMLGQKNGWKISDEVCIGIFTFEKLQMYLDIEKNKEAVLNNALLQVLVGAPLDNVGSFEKIPTENMLDNTIAPSDIKQVLDADSSQQVAIEAAKQGISFVIQGPPGTGKSQTIVNIIAELLSQGKKVLFVSEKMAALEVVKERLDSVGLGEYCLELHSHKANKKHILKQIEMQLNTRRGVTTTNEPGSVYKELKSIKTRLNNYGEELLKPRGNMGYSLYSAIGKYTELEKIPYIKHSVGNISTITPEEFNNSINSLKKLEAYPYEIKHYYEHVWRGVKITDFSITNIRNLYEYVDKLNDSSNDLMALLEKLSSQFDILPNTLKELESVLDFFITLINKPNSFELNPAWFTTDIKEQTDVINNISKLIQDVENLSNTIRKDYKEDFLKIDYVKHLELIGEKFKSKFNLLKPSYWGERSYLLKFTNKKKKFSEIKEDLERLRSLNEKKVHLKERIEIASKYELFASNGEINNWHLLSDQLIWIDNLKVLPGLLTTKIVDFAVHSYNDLITFQRDGTALYSSFKEQLPIFIDEYFDLANSVLKAPFNENKIEDILNWLKNLSEDRQRIREWIEFSNSLNELDASLKGFVNKYIEKNNPSAQLAEAYIRVFLECFIEHFLSESKLTTYTGKNSLKDANDFKRLDKLISDISRSLIIKDLESKKPGLNSFSHTSSSELATLRREIQKERRHMPLRRLLANVSSLITTLKPCFMMSPLSVAYYIDMETMNSFDCVIFDEASQIMPEDAVCSLIRAKSAIIVGDTQQLPPTRFFDSLDMDFDIDEELEDLNSILSEASTVLGEKYLKWHYRSRDEDLIAFSNRNFYDSRLVTFPNNKYSNKDTGIEFIHSKDGVYDRGGSRQNVNEAKKVVSLIREHIDKTPSKSLGVVAFSMQQQRAIMEQVEVFIKQNPKYNSFFEQEDVLDEFFIKNLENVQGDERDVMIFSIGYGPDQGGKMSLNFGPINKTGGYKRLNVAITRAKEKVILVSSFLPEDIERGSITNTGVQYMLNYMRYAKNGYKELIQDMHIEDVVSLESAFEESVYEKLTSRGWDISTQVGVSGYRIDLAVKHPNEKGNFILGIECDGKAYHSSKTARDRDRLRQSVLENLGWHIHRIWSTDWLINTNKEIEKIEEILQILIKNNSEDAAVVKKGEKIDNFISINTNSNDVELVFPKYKRMKLSSISGGISRFNQSYYSYLDNQIQNVVNTESPVHTNLVLKRIAEAWGFAKVGANIRKKTLYVIRSLNNKSISSKNDILWKNDPKVLSEFRMSDEVTRPFEFIPMEELGYLVIELLRIGFSIEKDDLLLEVSKYLGYARRGTKIQKHLNSTLTYLLKNKLIVDDGSRIKISEQYATIIKG